MFLLFKCFILILSRIVGVQQIEEIRNCEIKLLVVLRQIRLFVIDCFKFVCVLKYATVATFVTFVHELILSNAALEVKSVY